MHPMLANWSRSRANSLWRAVEDMFCNFIEKSLAAVSRARYIYLAMAHSPSKTCSGQHRSKKTARTSPRSYTPLSDALSQPFTFVDTELSEGIARHGLVGLL